MTASSHPHAAPAALLARLGVLVNGSVVGLTALSLSGCSKEAAVEKTSAQEAQEAPAPPAPAAETRAATAATAASAKPAGPSVDRARVIAFVERWVKAQNDSDFDAYAALYAEDFAGIKRVGDKETRFDRPGWLADRRRMFERDARVVASNFEVLRGRDTVAVSFDQVWSTSTFSDRGRKLLTLRPKGSELEIAREEMLSSQLASAKERSGACAALSEQIESGAGGLRYFANIASAGSTPEWVAAASLAEANERAADGTAWEEWTLAAHEGWRLASRSASSPSDDWVQRSELCFRPDGTLAQLTDTYRTFYSELGMIEVSSMSTHSHDGAVLSSKSSARVAATGQPAAPDSYQHIDPPLVMKFDALPFAALAR